MEPQTMLAIDVGNSHIVFGIFQNDTLCAHWRISTHFQRTADEYAVFLKQLMDMSGIAWNSINAISIASVVPPVLSPLIELSQNHLRQEPFIVQPTATDPMKIHYKNPDEVGADRIVNAYAAYKEYGGPLIIVDFGTATTFCAVNGQGEYLGGAIVPGLMISAEALFQKTAKLPKIQITKPRTVIGITTLESMQSGLFFGYVEMVDGLIQRMLAELDGSVKVLATGGLSKLFQNESQKIQLYDPTLTLRGLKYLYEKARL